MVKISCYVSVSDKLFSCVVAVVVDANDEEDAVGVQLLSAELGPLCE